MIRCFAIAAIALLVSLLFDTAPAEANCFDNANAMYQTDQNYCRGIQDFPNCRRCIYGNRDSRTDYDCNYSYETSTGNNYEYSCYQRYLNWERNERRKCLQKAESRYKNAWNRCK